MPEKKVKASGAEATKSTGVKAAEVKPKEIKKEEPQKEAVKETVAAVKEAPQKADKKPVAKSKKPVKEKTVIVPEVFVQYVDEQSGNQQADVADIVAKVKAAYVAEGHRESSIKSLQVYMKPQEWAAYYVINKKIEGRIDLF